MDLNALAAQFGGVASGQPAAPQGPAWMQNLSPAQLAKIQVDKYEEGRKRLAVLQAQIANSGQTIDDLNEFGRLNRQHSTGSLWQQITPDKPLFRSEGSMEMKAIQNRLAPAQRPEGSGASSDRDVSMFLSSLPSIENPGNVNRGIREDFERKYKAAIEKATAMEKYLQENGNLMDFDSQWAQRKTQSAASTKAAPTMRFNPTTNKLEQVK